MRIEEIKKFNSFPKKSLQVGDEIHLMALDQIPVQDKQKTVLEVLLMYLTTRAYSIYASIENAAGIQSHDPGVSSRVP